MDRLSQELVDRIAEQARGQRGLSLLLLFGSRARGESHEGSDWDFGYLGTAALDVQGLLADLVSVLGCERVDVVDLGSAGALLRFRAARDGILLHESRRGMFEELAVAAASHWCDIGPVVRPAYEANLAELHQ